MQLQLCEIELEKLQLMNLFLILLQNGNRWSFFSNILFCLVITKPFYMIGPRNILCIYLTNNQLRIERSHQTRHLDIE